MLKKEILETIATILVFHFESHFEVEVFGDFSKIAKSDFINADSPFIVQI